MPTYQYQCPKCDLEFEEIKGIKAHCADPSARCTRCEHPCNSADRIISRPAAIIGASVSSPEFNPGLGQVVKDKRHKDYLMKQKGVVEVGNDFGSGEKQQKEFEQKKTEQLERNWNTGLGEIEVK